MTLFRWIRKPNFNDIQKLDYNQYWIARGASINGSLKDREKVIASLIPQGAKVLDMGCGNSLLPLELKNKGCQVEVADISALILEEYRKRGITAHEIDLNDHVSLAKLPSDDFDYVILSEVLEHLPNPEEIVAFFARRTSNIVITIPNSAFFWFRLGLMFRGRFFTQWVHHPSEHLRFWSHIDFLDWLESLGMKTTSHRSSNGTRILKDIWPNMFGFQIVYVCSTRN